ncbi:Gfo/Idh/MocA family protein [Planctomicrobium sp. SH664]|uniref:Gfo/Idh/MocA family protein n=1 Tax=Planctomicrobium sp. SH664 TaxID=3448125 RepID=UPI003F5B1F98
MSQAIRVGIIGAGAIAKFRHIPGLRRIAGVDIVGVVNSSEQSTQTVAKEQGIPRTYAKWQDLVADPEIDAIVIGTGPNLHCEITCAALAAGKHVLCESRMSRNLAEARTMLAAAKAHPKLVTQLVPSPYGLECGPAVDHLVRSYFLGDLREVVVLGADDMFWDYSQPLHWRQDIEISGNNILRLGILQETLMRWAPAPVQVFAQTEIFEPTRPLPGESRFVSTAVPDSVQILAELENGGRAIYHISGVILFGPGLQLHLYGSRGTIKIHFVNGEEIVTYGRAEDKELKRLELPADDKGRWQVEEDFIAAIRGERPVTLTTFETGVKYMEFLEAVHLSAKENGPVSLPLE